MIATIVATTRAAPLKRFNPSPSLLLILGFGGFLLLDASHLLSDPDSQWHIAIGKWIVANGTVPRTDIFSHTFAGSPWIAKEWVSQLVLYGLYALGGWWAVAMGTAAVIALSFGALFAWLRQRMAWTPALIATLAAFLLYQPHFLARPHILVLPIVLAWSMILVDALDRRTIPPLWSLGLMVLWTNMHGSFPLGLVIAGVLAGEGILLRPPGSRFAAARRWALFMLLAMAATMISPFGWHAILVPLEMSGNAETLQYVNEWRPLTMDQMGVSATIVLIVTVAIYLSDWRSTILRLILTGLLAYLMIRHARFIGLFGLLAPILAARGLGQLFPKQERDAGGKPIDTLVTWGVAGGLALLLACLATSMTPRPDASITPQAAYDFARTHAVTGPVYNDYDFGGFLIARGVKTFVDGRTDQLFLNGFLPRLNAAITNRLNVPFAAMLDTYKVTWALTATHSPTSAHLAAMPGWSNAYEDAVATVYIRRSSTAGPALTRP